MACMQEGENYVDEQEVSEYLRQIGLENSEQELLAICPEVQEEQKPEVEEQDGMQEAASWLAATDQETVLELSPSDSEGAVVDTLHPGLMERAREVEVREEAEVSTYAPSSGRGKRSNVEEFSEAQVLETLGSLETDLEPLIQPGRGESSDSGVGGGAEVGEVYREEAEYLDLDGGELVPQIESPPPYSEVGSYFCYYGNFPLGRVPKLQKGNPLK